MLALSNKGLHEKGRKEIITHIVLLQPKPEVTEEQLATALAHVCDLQQVVPGIFSVQAAKNLNASGDKNKGYTHGFVMQFVDSEALSAYAPHPAHQTVGAELRSVSQSIIDFDIPNL